MTTNLQMIRSVSNTLPKMRFVFVLLFSGLVLSLTTATRATVFTVTNLNDSGAGSLRQAILDANTQASSDVINISVTGTITLTSGQLSIANNGSLTINGPGASNLVVSGNNVSRVFQIQPSANVSINSLTVANGHLNPSPDGCGAGIHVDQSATFILNSSVVRNNRTDDVSCAAGGGIANRLRSVATIINSTISNNYARIGAGVYNQLGTTYIINSTISNNTAKFISSGVYGSDIDIVNSTVSNNTTENVSNNSGTISNADSRVPFNVINSIVANSIGAPDCYIIADITINFQNSLVEDGSCGVINGVNGNRTGDPNLGPLQNNGGPTPTHALLPGSIAINGGNNWLAADQTSQPLINDQRGSGFTRISDLTVDMGAYELFITDPARFMATTTITSDSPDPSAQGNAFTVFYNVAVVAPGTGTPTGTVTVSDGVQSCTGTVAAGQCSLTLDTIGNRFLRASYAGDANFNNGISAAEPHTVSAVGPPSVTEHPQSQSVNIGSPVTFTSRGGVFAQTAPSSLSGGQALFPGQSLISPNFGYQLVYQFDGNLVMYRGDGAVRWASNTAGTSPGRAEMQSDGNFVIYNSVGTPLFATGTAGNPGSTIVMQSDGNLVVYNSGGTPIFSTGTFSSVPIPTVQWQVSTDGGANFADIGGATTPILSFTAGSADNGKQYRAVFTNPSGSTASSAAILTVKANTTITITSDSPDPTQQGENFNVTFSVAVVAPGTGTPTGNVTVGDGVNSCVGTVATGQCSLALNTAGNRTLTATYAGDANFNGSSSAGEPHTVTNLPPETLVVDNTSNDGNLSACTAGANDCSLPGAINHANAYPGDDTIDFDAGIFSSPQTISLASGQRSQLVINNNGKLTINGPGADRLSVSNADSNSRVILIDRNVVVEISGLTIKNGVILDSGGGIFNEFGATLTLTNCTVSGNSALNGNGGGIFNFGTANVTNSTISGNSSQSGGGGIASFGTMTLTNSTVSGNAEYGSTGGGINNSGTLNLIYSTVTGNSSNFFGGGIYDNGGNFNSRNSIIAGNTAFNGGPDFSGTINSQGYNLIGNDSGASITGDPTGNILNQNPQLAPLGFYGGQTQTHALLSNSPAVNNGNSSGAPPADQRGAGRVGNTDIGAFELNNSANGGNYVAQLPDGRQMNPYSYDLIPDNGSFTYTVSGGALPNGLNLTTHLAPAAIVGISGTPTNSGNFNFSVTASDGTNSNITDYALNILAPTAAGISVSGRVLTNSGRGIFNAVVTLTEQTGARRMVRTNQFGYFNFVEIGAGQTIVLSVSSKQYHFVDQVLFVSEDAKGLDFIAVGGR
ncbi:MAG: choice-of-anchor Q domain-containing protein [Pyrinomonadaceae bacterium]